MPAASFNPLVSKLSPPPVPSVFAWGRAYDGECGPLIDLSQAVPGYPPHPDMLAWLAESAGSRAYAGYGPIEGETELRTAYATEQQAIYGANVTVDNIHITAGCNQAFIAAAMALAGNGDSVGLTEPFYFNQETTLGMLGIRRELLPLDPATGFVPTLEGVHAVLAKGVKAIALVSPNNPTGAIYPADLLRDIFEACRSAGAFLILDETYRDFLPGHEHPHDLLSVPGWEDNLILLYSFSKSFCIPGHRLGAITAGPRAVAEIAKVMDNLQICAPRAPQAAVARAIPALRDWREVNRAEILARAETLKSVMADLPAWKMDSIGAYFAFIRHPFDGQPSALIAEQLAKRAGILCIPGAYFGDSQQAYLRFAFANADSETIRGLTARLTNFILD
ncbi:aminotransferase class I and II [Rhizobium sp. PDO1-076]|uniref:aminotransferase n=1 Tax=Rhizobium sp. PDO1-076 TaxID=1125979 RepID=UPI00024E262E|nr:aminotransferase [Rhizobium sp. PDO1-076]EHS49329.1 aminotransferase class I and II [Rhizobium sp. PDO1-076]